MIDHHAENFVGLAEIFFDLMGINSFVDAVIKQGARLGFHTNVWSGGKEIQRLLIEILSELLFVGALQNEFI